MRGMHFIFAAICLSIMFGMVCGNLFAGDSPVLPIAAKLQTLFIIGDSTVKNGTKGLQGWGEVIGDLFDPSKITVENHARGGRSSRTFLTEGLWNDVASHLKPGDFVLMQFGHNDGGGAKDAKGRGSIHGNGEETEDVTDPKTGKTETVHSFGWYMRKYVADTKARGATPIVLSLVPRCIWKDENHVNRATADYGKWAREAAEMGGAQFIDLNGIIANEYDKLGQTKVHDEYFGAGDHTHTTPAGAVVNAKCVTTGIRQLPDCKLKDYLK